MLLATVTFTFLGNYIFTAVVVVHLINKEAVRPNPRPVSAKQMSFAPQRAEYVLNTLQSLQIHEANQLLRGKSTEEVTKNTEYVWSVVYMTYASAGNL